MFFKWVCQIKIPNSKQQEISAWIIWDRRYNKKRKDNVLLFLLSVFVSQKCVSNDYAKSKFQIENNKKSLHKLSGIGDTTRNVMIMCVFVFWLRVLSPKNVFQMIMPNWNSKFRLACPPCVIFFFFFLCLLFVLFFPRKMFSKWLRQHSNFQIQNNKKSLHNLSGIGDTTRNVMIMFFSCFLFGFLPLSCFFQVIMLKFKSQIQSNKKSLHKLSGIGDTTRNVRIMLFCVSHTSGWGC